MIKEKLPRFYGDHEIVAPLNGLSDAIASRTLLNGTNYEVDRTPKGQRLRIKIPPAATASGEIEQFRVVTVRRDHLVCNRYTKTPQRDEGGALMYDADGNLLYTESVDSEEVKIAKPFELRATPWHGREIDNKRYSYTQNGTDVDPANNPHNYRTVTILGEPNASGSIPLGDLEFWPDTASGETVVLKEKIWPEYIPSHTLIYAAKVKQSPVVYNSYNVAAGPGYDAFTSTEIVEDWVEISGQHKWEMEWSKVKVCIKNADDSVTSGYVLVRTSNTFDLE